MNPEQTIINFTYFHHDIANTQGLKQYHTPSPSFSFGRPDHLKRGVWITTPGAWVDNVKELSNLSNKNVHQEPISGATTIRRHKMLTRLQQYYQEKIKTIGLPIEEANNRMQHWLALTDEELFKKGEAFFNDIERAQNDPAFAKRLMEQAQQAMKKRVTKRK